MAQTNEATSLIMSSRFETAQSVASYDESVDLSTNVGSTEVVSPVPSGNSVLRYSRDELMALRPPVCRRVDGIDSESAFFLHLMEICRPQRCEYWHDHPYWDDTYETPGETSEESSDDEPEEITSELVPKVVYVQTSGQPCVPVVVGYEKAPHYIDFPFSYESIQLIVTPYTDKSPFFLEFFRDYTERFGKEVFVDVLNDYLSATQFKRGTVDYFNDWLFQTRRRRDDLISYMRNRRPVAQMAAVVEENVIQQEENVTFTDQREAVQDTGYMGGQIEPNLQGLSMQEGEWHVRNVMSKPIVIKQLSWSTSQTLGTELYSALVPGDLLKGPHLNLTTSFVFWRGHPRIRVQLNGTKFHFGRLICAFIPTGPEQIFNGYYNLNNLTAMPHVILDASNSNSGILDLPFVHVSSYFNTITARPFQYLGMFKIFVFNQLGTTTTASPTIDVTCWISFDNCELHQPCQQHPLAFPTTPVAHAGVEGLIKSILPMATSAASSMLPGIAGNVLPHLTKTAGNVLGMAKNCDKPEDPQEISRWVPNTVTSLNFGDGLDKSNRLSLQNGTYTVSEADLISATSDDANLLQLMKIPTRLATLQWSTADPPGKLLKSIPVAPNMVSFIAETGQEDVITPTLIGYCSRAFKYYRGGLSYKIQIIASLMQSGRIQVSFLPGFRSSEFDVCNYINPYIIDLQERNEVAFVVPYMSERPWMRCDKFSIMDSILATDGAQSTGALVFHVLNRLSCPDSTAQVVEINVFISAADDFEVAFPTDFSYCRGIGPATSPMAHMQAEENVTTRRDHGTVVLTKDGGLLSASASSTMSENGMDLKTVLRRYTKVLENQGSVTDYGIIAFPNTPMLGEANNASGKFIQYRTPLCHFSEMFTMWDGTLRYKMIFLNNSDSHCVISVFHVPGVFGVGNFSLQTISESVALELGSMEANGVMIASSGIQASMEFSIPCYKPFTQLQTIPNLAPSAIDCTGTIILKVHSPFKQSDLSFEIYQAAGDDYRLNYFRSCPIIRFKKQTEILRDLNDNAPWLYPPPPSSDKSKFVKDPPLPQAHMLASACRTVVQSFSDLWRLPTTVATTCNTVTQVVAAAGEATGLISVNGDETVDSEDSDGAATGPIHLALVVLGEFLRDLPSTVGGVKSLTGWAVSIANIVSGFNSFLTASSLFVKACAIVTMCSELLGSVLDRMKSRLLTIATNILETLNGGKQGNQPPPVAHSSFIDFAGVLVATLSCALVAIGFKAIPDTKEAEGMIKNLKDRLMTFNQMNLAITNIKSIWHSLKETTDECVDYLLSLFAPQILAQMKLVRGFDDIEVWAAEVDRVMEEDYVDRSNYDTDFRYQCLRLVDQANRYNALLLRGKLGREASVIREYVRKCIEMGALIEDSYKQLPNRIDPVCFLIHGQTGLGKSGIITTFAHAVMDNLGYPKEKRMCNMNLNSKYFPEDYRSHRAVYGDDIGAMNKQEQYEMFFNLKANTKFCPEKAFRKYLDPFVSDFIWLTSNIPWMRPNCVADIPALWRRFDGLIEARWLPHLVTPEQRVKRLDGTHAEFRWCDPMDPQGPKSAWVGPAQMVIEMTEFARRHLEIQQRKLCYDLIKLGYTIPPPTTPFMAEAADQYLRELRGEIPVEGEEVFVDAEEAIEEGVVDGGLAHLGGPRTLSREACEQNPHLSLFSDSPLFDQLEWHIDDSFLKGRFVLPVQNENFGEVYQQCGLQWIELQEYANNVGFDLQLELYKCCSSNRLIASLDLLKTKLAGFKDWLSAKWNEALVKYPFLEVVSSWPVKLAAALVAVAGVVTVGAKTIHSCVCAGVRYFGYRCPVCGKWPDIEKCADKEWLKSEWALMYGPTSEYASGTVTSLEEEQNFMTLADPETKLQHPFAGTKLKRQAQMGPYSENTPGLRSVKIVANQSPYSHDVPGLARGKIMANNGQRTEDLINHRLLPYLYRVRCVKGQTFSMNCFAVGDRNVLINKHFLDIVEGSFDIYHNNAWMTVRYNKDLCTVFPGKDLVLYQMPLQFHQHRDLSKHFISEKDLPKLTNCRGVLVKQTSNQQYCLEQVNPSAVKDIKYVEATGNAVYYVQGAWKYRATVGQGMCGSVLITLDDKTEGQILGFHAAGDGVFGWSQLVTKEMLAGLIKTKLGTPLPEVVSHMTSMTPDGHFGIVGRVEKGKGVFQTSKTQIVPTSISGKIRVPVTAPSVLSSKDPRLATKMNVVNTALSKYGQPPLEFNPEHLSMVFESLESEIDNWDVQRKPSVLTKEEAVLGCPEYEGFDRLPMNTSPGWPYTISRPSGVGGKAYLFDVDTGKVANEELRIALESRLALAKQGERSVSVWTCCLKDERRPLAKVASGSTRMFVIPPVDYSIITRMYTLDFSIAIKDNRHTSFSMVGIDPQSLEWTHLYQRMASFSEYCFAGDFSKFDGTLVPEVQQKYTQHCNSFYKKRSESWKQEDDTVRMTLMEDATNTVLIAGNDVFLTHTGNKSGDPNTVNKNSFGNKYYVSLAYLGLAGKHAPQYATMANMRKFVLDFYYGDDNYICVKREILDWFNQESVSEYLSQYGITYTNAAKTGLTKYMKISEGTFLKNGFGDHESITGIKVPLMAKDTIYELLNWTRVAPDQNELLESNCNDALRFMYFYGRAAFEELRCKIISALRQEDLKFDIMTYSDFHFWFLYVTGKLGVKTAQGFFESVAANGNGKLARVMNKVVFGLPYLVLSAVGLLRGEKSIKRTDDRYAIAIPSGEGKSWLCREYPSLFVDHDELLLPAARRILKEHGLSLSHLSKMFDLEFPINDRRVLLVHHPDNTRRQILGKFVLPKPAWIRANAYQRLRLSGAEKLERTSRNEEILKRVGQAEPQLGKFHITKAVCDGPPGVFGEV